MTTREQIINSMCFTWRHDYGLLKEGQSLSGMTQEERVHLYERMAKIFDNDIAPRMEFKKEPRKTEFIRDRIIEVHSFELTESQKRQISMGLKYGPAAAYVKNDDICERPKSWKSWFLKKFLGCK